MPATQVLHREACLGLPQEPDDLRFRKSLLHVRSSFPDDRTLNLRVTQNGGDVDGGKVDLSKDLCAVGKYQQVNVSTLVKQVVISPYAQDWFGELVASVARRYGLEVPVGKSALAEPPTWG